ncbi:hypothetical protein [Mesorhizobium sp. B2-6-4]|uniref:hypothetical protein n=1 Tax=Mesorhizobium sp. B2-6-4 TaxID=2589913 RepID=UPI001125E736|nr:hypothetical protein [Mesorhizobium sp. B2-6-4]TPJ52715.1 hypothetical protein FJ426_15800 [Mesorhizobium sp. B2-6-4]
MVSYIFGPDQQYKTPGELAKARAVANAILMNQGAPKNVGEGLSAIGQALLFRSMMGKADASEAAGKTAADAAFNPVLAALGGSTAFPAAPGASSKVADAMAGQPKADNPNLPSSMDFANAQADAPQTADAAGLPPTAFAGVTQAGKGWTEVQTADGQTIRREGARNWRNNNPGNIEYGPLARSMGAVGTDGRFAVFPTLEAGRAAKEKLLFDGPGYRGKTLAGAISRWAPPSENDTPAYIGAMASAAGVSPDTPLSAFSPEQRSRALVAMEHIEGFRPGREIPSSGGALAAVNAEAAGQPVEVASLDPSVGIGGGARPLPAEYASNGTTQAQWAAMNRPGEDLTPVANGAPAPIPMQGPQGQAAPASASPIAQALFGKPAAPQPQMTAQTDPSMVPAAAGGAADTFNAAQGPNMQQLYNALQQPFLSDAQKGIIESEIQRQQQAADPLRQLQLQKARRDLTNPQKNWQRLDDTHLFDPESGEIKAADGGASDGKFRFKGSSVEAQGLNGLMDAGQITEDQAQQLAAGKTITDPTTGAIIFMTPQGVFGQSPQGGQPQPVMPSPQAMPQPQGQPQSAPIAPPAPNAGQQQAPAVAPPAADPANPQQQGMIPLTGPKPVKPPTEQQVRNQQLYQVAAPELKIVEDNFGALSNLSDQAWSAIPGAGNYGANYLQTPQYQRANNSLKTIIATYLYSTSGATANPGEVENQASILMPKPGEDPTSVADKLARVRVMVDSIKTAGGGGGQAGDPAADPKAALKQKYGLD